MASDRGKQQAYCKVCSKHFSVSHGRIDDVRRHGEGKRYLELFNGFLKKITDFPRVVPHFLFGNLTCLHLGWFCFVGINFFVKVGMFSLQMSEHIGCVASSVGNLGPTLFANSLRLF